MSKFNFKFLHGFAIALVALSIGFWLMNSSITTAGVSIPKELDQLTTAASQPGYQVPAAIDASCFPKEQISAETLAEIQKVTQATPQDCNFTRQHSFNNDAWWGLAAFLLVCALIFLAFKLMKSSRQVEIAVVAGLLLGVAVISALLDDVLRQWLTDMDVIMTIFVRAFFASAAVAVGLFLAHETTRKMAEKAVADGHI